MPTLSESFATDTCIQSELPFQASNNVHCLSTSYDDVDSLANILKSNEIHTVISTVNPPTPEVHDAQENLIRAAAQSESVKRFIPSEWGMDYTADDEYVVFHILGTS